MKVCHLTSVHKSTDVRIFYKECCSLSKAGYKVYLISPNVIDEILENVSIVGIKTYNNRLLRMTKTVWNVYKKAKIIDAKIYHIHDPELLVIGLLLKARGKVVIYDSHEDLPRQILDKPWINPLLRRLISKLTEYVENFISRRYNAIVAATPTIKNRFVRINPNTVNINNYPIINVNNSMFPWNERKNEICYIGGIFKKRGIVELVEALEYLPDNIKLNLAGNFSPTELKGELIKKKGWNKVIELGFVGREKINEILAYSKIGIVTLHPTESYLDSLPVKMFEYMSAGIPVIASDFLLWKSLIEENNLGICVDPLDPKAIAEAILYLFKNEKSMEQMGINGRKAVQEKYNWNNEENKLLKLYKSLE